MKKEEIFTFIDRNGKEIDAVVIAAIQSSMYLTVALCYDQHSIFTFYEHTSLNESGEIESECSYGEIIVGCAVLPDYDIVLEGFRQQRENTKTV